MFSVQFRADLRQFLRWIVRKPQFLVKSLSATEGWWGLYSSPPVRLITRAPGPNRLRCANRALALLRGAPRTKLYPKRSSCAYAGRNFGPVRYTTATAKRPLSLEISTRELAGVTIVDLDGRATIGDTNDCLNKTLRDLVSRGAHKLLLNLANLTQVDSSSIGTIAGMFVSLDREGGSLKLLRPRGRVRTALDVMRLLDFIPNFEDEAEALASFEQRGHSAAT